MKPDSRPLIDFDAVKRMPFESIAVDWGYVRDPEASTRANPVLRAEGQPKLVTRRQSNGHWVYFNTLDPDDNGTVIDFMLNRSMSFAEIREWFGKPAAATSNSFHSLWQQAKPDPQPPWLGARGIERQTLEFYRPLIRCDRAGYTLFAHRDQNRNLTGFEIGPPDGVKRFSTGGTRSLFALRAAEAAKLQSLVITESAVDALSLAQIEHCPSDRAFLSTAGAPSAKQCRQISLATHAIPGLKTVILAHDNDIGGERQANTLRDKLKTPPHVTVTRHRPPQSGDWNDIITAAAPES